MSGYLVIDCETSGLVDFKQPADAPGQGRLAALAMIALDASFEKEHEAIYYVRPDGWVIDPEAASVNKLTTEFLEAHGQPIDMVLGAFVRHVLFQDRGVLGWGAQFDLKILRGERRRLGQDDLFELTPNTCVMRAATKPCGIQQAGRRGLKWPKLEEAVRILLHSEPRNLHEPLADANYTADIARELWRQGLLPEPSVHYAKNRAEAA